MTFKNKVGWGIVVAFVCAWAWHAYSSIVSAVNEHNVGAHDSRWPTLDGDCDSYLSMVHWDVWTGMPTLALFLGLVFAAVAGVVYLIADEPYKDPLPQAIVVEGNVMVDKCS